MEFIAIPITVLEDIGSIESRKYIIDRLVFAHSAIDKQTTYIAELEQKVDDLQKALDAVLLNKCRTRKVKVKVYGRNKKVLLAETEERLL